jgi:divalent metal cation (Fe/Co/Zn/Cd) transporter
VSNHHRADAAPATAAGPNDSRAKDSCATDACHATAAPSAERDAGWQRAAKTARALSWVSLLWMTGEGALGLVAGAAAESISLIGWALGSAIEGLASIIVIWRFTGTRTLSENAERRAQKAVAVSFFLLAPYIAVESVRYLITGHESATSVLGIVVTAASVIIMPALGLAKQRLGRRLDSGATAGEGVQNLICAGQAAAVLLGLALTVTLGWWWIDPVIGLLLAAFAIHEGREAWHGEDCC